jgi:membrane protein
MAGVYIFINRGIKFSFMNAKSAVGIVKGSFKEFNEDNVLRLSAALAYYSIFSIGPLLAIVIGVAGLAFGHDAARHQIHDSLKGMLGENSAQTIDSMIAARSRGTSVITTIIGIIALLFGAAGVFGQLQDSLNTIWEVKSKPGAGIWDMLRKRFLSFSMVLGVGFLLLISLALSAALAALSHSLNNMIPMGDVVGHVIDFVVSFGVITLLFAMMFKYLPDVKIPWSKVWMGAIVTALLFTLGKFLLGLYLGRQSTSSAYGAAGSVIVILMWVYYASVILLYGAEFTQVYARQTGAKIVPSKYAVPVSEKERAEEGIPKDKPGQTQPAGSPEEWQGVGAGAMAGRSVPGKTLSDEALDVAWITFAAGCLVGALLRIKPVRKAVDLYTKNA